MSKYPNHITGTAHHFTAVVGNCSMLSLSRLSATYVPNEKVTEHNEQVIGLYTKYLTGSKSPNIFSRTPTNLSTLKLRAHTIPGSTVGLALPVEWGFATILEEIITTRAPTILFCSDVENGGVDGHKGDYRTGNFADWCITEGIAAGERAIGRKIRSTKAYEVYAWNLVFNPEAATRLIDTCNKEFTDFYSAMAGSKKLTAALSAAKQAVEDQKRRLTAAWDAWSPPVFEIDDEDDAPVAAPTREPEVFAPDNWPRIPDAEAIQAGAAAFEQQLQAVTQTMQTDAWRQIYATTPRRRTPRPGDTVRVAAPTRRRVTGAPQPPVRRPGEHARRVNARTVGATRARLEDMFPPNTPTPMYNLDDEE